MKKFKVEYKNWRIYIFFFVFGIVGWVNRLDSKEIKRQQHNRDWKQNN